MELNQEIHPDFKTQDIRHQKSKRGISVSTQTLIHYWVLCGHWYPCFEFLVTSPLGFKARVGSFICAW